MTQRNLVLSVATYTDAEAAKSDLDGLKDVAKADEFKVVGSVLLSKDADGKVHVNESGEASPMLPATGIGTVTGVVVGLFAPPLLVATAAGAGLGAVVGGMVKAYEQHKFGVDMDEYLPNNSSAVAVLVDDQYTDRVDKALGKADKRINKAVDADDAQKLEKALDASSDEIAKALNS